jgi:hypothetical protein
MMQKETIPVRRVTYRSLRQRFVRFEVLTATAMNTTVVWNVTPYNLVDMCQNSEKPFCFIFSHTMKVARLSATLQRYFTELRDV